MSKNLPTSGEIVEFVYCTLFYETITVKIILFFNRKRRLFIDIRKVRKSGLRRVTKVMNQLSFPC